MIYLNEMAVRSASRDATKAGFPNALSDCALDKGKRLESSSYHSGGP